MRANQERPSKQKIQQKSSVFASKTNRGTLKADENKPGPGDYDIKITKTGQHEDLEKKSFNKYYNYNPVKEIIPRVERVVVDNKQ